MHVQVYKRSLNRALETCVVWSEEVEVRTVVRRGFHDFSGDQALMGHTILQNWHVGGGSRSVNPVLGPRADSRDGDLEKVRCARV